MSTKTFKNYSQFSFITFTQTLAFKKNVEAERVSKMLNENDLKNFASNTYRNIIREKNNMAQASFMWKKLKTLVYNGIHQFHSQAVRKNLN